jgi:hypothetical protein
MFSFYSLRLCSSVREANALLQLLAGRSNTSSTDIRVPCTTGFLFKNLCGDDNAILLGCRPSPPPRVHTLYAGTEA